MTRRRYPIGIQTFSKIRENDMLYIDKTEYIYNMAHAAGTYYFLSRPRRFGKSLLVSTMQSYFEGRRDLFRGLAIEKLEKEWTEYPVILLSMAGAKHMDVEGLQEYLLYILKVNEERFGVEFHSAAPNLRLTNLIMAVYEKTGRQVVVLIDEYDAPLLDVAHEESQLVAMRDIMRNFYSPLKDCDPYLRFVFLTGITKFSQLSIFSELNNISNISMKDDYAGICGITETELLDDMQDGIAGLAQANELTPQQVVAKLKENYDGSISRRIRRECSIPSACSAASPTKTSIPTGSHRAHPHISSICCRDSMCSRRACSGCVPSRRLSTRRRKP